MPPAPIPPRAPRAPKGRRCRGRRCPPLGTSRSPFARDGGGRIGVQSVGEASRARQVWAWGSSFIALAPDSGAPHSPRSSRVSPGGPQRNRGSDPRRRLQRRTAISPLLATVPAAATAPRRQCNSCNSSPPTVKPVERSRVIPSGTFRTIPSETFSATSLSLARLRSCLLDRQACAPDSQAVAPPLRLQLRSRWAAAARAALARARGARATARAASGLARSGQPNPG